MPAIPVTFSARLSDRDLAELDELAKYLGMKRAQTLRLVVTDKLAAIKTQGVHPQELAEVIP